MSKSNFYASLRSKLINSLIVSSLFIGNLQLPVNVVQNTHDSGSQASLEYYLVNHFTYGRDIIQNVGPYGFLAYPDIYTGFLDAEKFILNLFLTVIFTCLSYSFFKKLLTGLPKFLWFLSVMLLTNHDSMLYLLVFMLSLTLIGHSQKNAGHDNTWIMFITLAILSLMKSTFLFVGLFVMLGYLILNFHNNPIKKAIVPVFIYAFTFVLLWFFSGQPLYALIDYPYSTIQFSSGYNQAMTLYESSFVTVCGVTSLLILILAVIAQSIEINCLLNRLVFILVESLIIYVVWKHGFVRGDGHVQIFFSFALAASTLLLFSRNSYVIGDK